VEAAVIAVIFRNRLAADLDLEEYQRRSDDLYQIVSGLPGFLSFRGYTAEDGERLALIEFESHEALKGWREHPRHREAQRLGRERYYTEYHLQVCECVRESHHPSRA
jgi:heme-degrading monooxygenase HmoA